MGVATYHASRGSPCRRGVEPSQNALEQNGTASLHAQAPILLKTRKGGWACRKSSPRQVGGPSGCGTTGGESESPRRRTAVSGRTVKEGSARATESSLQAGPLDRGLCHRPWGFCRGSGGVLPSGAEKSLETVTCLQGPSCSRPRISLRPSSPWAIVPLGPSLASGEEPRTSPLDARPQSPHPPPPPAIHSRSFTCLSDSPLPRSNPPGRWVWTLSEPDPTPRPPGVDAHPQPDPTPRPRFLLSVSDLPGRRLPENFNAVLINSLKPPPIFRDRSLCKHSG